MSNQISLRDNITIAEKDAFVKKVVSETFSEVTKPNYLLSKVAFVIHFITMFTDFEVIYKEANGETVIDSQAIYDAFVSLDFLKERTSVSSRLWVELKELVDKQVDFECKKILAYAATSSASDEAIEAVSSMAYAGLRAANKLSDIFENLLNVTSEEGLIKLLGNKEIWETASHIAGLVGELRGSAGDIFAQSQTDNVVDFPVSPPLNV